MRAAVLGMKIDGRRHHAGSTPSRLAFGTAPSKRYSRPVSNISIAASATCAVSASARLLSVVMVIFRKSVDAPIFHSAT